MSTTPPPEGYAQGELFEILRRFVVAYVPKERGHLGHITNDLYKQVFASLNQPPKP